MRLILNLLITTGLLFLFNAFGWLTLSHNGNHVEFSQLDWPTFGSILLIAVIMWLASYGVAFIWALSTLATLGLSLLAAPFFGWFVLKAAEYFMPDTLVLHGFWISVLCGWLLVLIRIPAREN